MDELNDIQRLAVAQAVYKAVSGVVSTKDEDSLRSECDRVLVEQYERTGAKSYDVSLNDQKVGTYSVKVSKAKSATERTVLVVDDWNAYLNECCTHLWHSAESYLIAASSEILDAYFTETGDVPTWAHTETHRAPAEPPRVTGTTLRVDTVAVAEAMGPMLGERVMGLLGGAE